MGLLRQQGEHPDLGRNWVIKFINPRAYLKTKIGRREEAKRFDSFTPKAVHWYFDIREGQYSALNKTSLSKTRQAKSSQAKSS
ncbi:Uncharacterized protein HZ326_21215 [Fusarium oxysporum f. sp. albedinis]|nr:Uncharacterized protein HZ326_21215 [Fusarium oxysporum f. sp. albedinis]